MTADKSGAHHTGILDDEGDAETRSTQEKLCYNCSYAWEVHESGATELCGRKFRRTRTAGRCGAPDVAGTSPSVER